MTNKIGKIEFLRFISSCIIVIGHLFLCLGIKQIKILNFTIANYYQLCVDFFFLLSGYFLANSASKIFNVTSISKETFIYIIKKVKKFFVEHVIAFFIIVITKLFIDNNFNILYIVEKLLIYFPSFAIMQRFEWPFEIVLDQEWYISEMLFSSIILYPLLLKYKKTFSRIVCPVIGVLLIGSIIHETASLNNVSDWLLFGIIRKSTLKAIAEMSLGIFMFEICSFIKQIRLSKHFKVLLTLVEIVNLFFCLYIINQEDMNFQIYYLLFMFIALTIILSEFSLTNKLFNNKLCEYLGKLSLPMYLYQAIATNTVRIFFSSKNNIYLLIGITISLLIVISTVVILISQKIKKYFDHFLFNILPTGEIREIFK